MKFRRVVEIFVVIVVMAIAALFVFSMSYLVRVKEIDNKITDLQRIINSNGSTRIIYWKILYLKPAIRRKLAWDISVYVHKYARFHGRDQNLVLAIMRVESNFVPKATGPATAQGLMQIHPIWKKAWRITDDLHTVEANIRWGMKVLTYYQETYKDDLKIALTAYNRGSRAVDLDLGRGRDPSNGYEGAVLELYKKLGSLDEH